MSLDTFGTRESLNHNGKNFEIFNIQQISGSADLPFSLKILLSQFWYNTVNIICNFGGLYITIFIKISFTL